MKTKIVFVNYNQSVIVILKIHLHEYEKKITND